MAGMTKSELIARLAARFPQLVAKDADFAVKMILDAMTDGTGARRSHRDPRLRQLRAQLPAAAHRAQSEVRREGAGAGKVRAALQGRQGIARAGRCSGPEHAGLRDIELKGGGQRRLFLRLPAVRIDEAS